MLDMLHHWLLLAQDGPTLMPAGTNEAADTAAHAATIGPWANLIYLVAAILFIRGIKGMTHPRSAVRGNLTGALGMLLAVLVTVWQLGVMPLSVAIVGMIIGTAVGYVMATRVQMTQMPQMVGLLNGFGGLASVLVAGAEATTHFAGSPNVAESACAAGLSGLIGAVTFTGSMVAAGKLQELDMFRKPWSFPGHQLANAALLILCLLLTFMMLGGHAWPYFLIVLLAGLLGVLLVAPIGGADMPVVIALLNSYSGLAASAAGFVINNNVLIIAGSLVGASGIILSGIMCEAMNRSLANVLFGKLQAAEDAPSADDVYAGKIKATSAEEVAMLLDGVQRVVIVPGYGLAVAQAQHSVRDLANLLEARGADGRVRDPPSRRPDAGPHERAAGRGRRALRPAERDGRDQSHVRPGRRGDRDRRQRRGEPGGQHRSQEPDRRHAYSSTSTRPARSSSSSGASAPVSRASPTRCSRPTTA